jgi:hypothetical protein
MNIEVSPGEVIDKISILEIKLDRITDPEKLANVRREYDYLVDMFLNEYYTNYNSADEYYELYGINGLIWDAENIKRKKEKLQEFDEEFIQAARQTYIQNDKRSELKKIINNRLNSRFIEEKQHN